MSSFGATIGQWAGEWGHSAIAGKIAETLGPTVLSGVVDQLNANGLGAKVNSWLGKGDNQPLTPEEVRQALGSQRIHDLASRLGLPADQISDILAKSLPAAVDQASPNGVLEPGPASAPSRGG